MSNNVDSYTSSSEYSNDEPSTWISWFCEQPQNSFFCEIDYQYIDSTFNLFGLKKEVRRFNYCREIIIEELDSSASECSSGVPPEWGNHGSADLYGRIHVRYLNTAQGQRAMTAKFLRGQFGHCPLYSCKNQKVLPIGMSDVVGQCPVKVYCPRCQDVYDTPRSGLDGAFFGRTFLPFLLLCAPELIPKVGCALCACCGERVQVVGIWCVSCVVSLTVGVFRVGCQNSCAALPTNSVRLQNSQKQVCLQLLTFGVHTHLFTAIFSSLPVMCFVLQSVLDSSSRHQKRTAASRRSCQEKGAGSFSHGNIFHVRLRRRQIKDLLFYYFYLTRVCAMCVQHVCNTN